MARTNFEGMACSIARTWSLVGQPWAALIVRDVALGLRRFDELQMDLGVARNVLSARLAALEEGGVLARRAYKEEGRTRDEYVLTTAGEELVPLIVAIAQWGERHRALRGGPPLHFRHACGHRVQLELTCDGCGEHVEWDTLTPEPGRGGRRRAGTKTIGDPKFWARRLDEDVGR